MKDVRPMDLNPISLISGDGVAIDGDGIFAAGA